MIPSEIKEFIESSLTNQWLTVGNLNIYVRKSHRFNPKLNRRHKNIITCFDIANVSCGHKGCGEFTRFLKSLNTLNEHGFQAIYVEQVLGNRFAQYFRRLGWIETNAWAAIPSFYYMLEV